MGNSIQERLVELIDTQYDGVKTRFCEKNDISKGTFFSLLKKNTNPSFDMIQKILMNHKNINPYWLILGEGKKGDTSILKKHESCEEKLEAAQKEIEYLKKINSLLEKQNN